MAIISLQSQLTEGVGVYLASNKRQRPTVPSVNNYSTTDGISTQQRRSRKIKRGDTHCLVPIFCVSLIVKNKILH